MKTSNRLAFKGGSYSLIITAIVLAILIVVNICVASLPTSATKFDISSSKLYSITSNTKVVVNALDKDVTIYWIVQADKEDDVIENLLGKYESLSDHISVIKKNPDEFPTFAEKYTSETVANNSLVVECGDRYRYIPYSDIYVQDADMYSYSYSTSFDGEGAITSAIDYVTTDELPQLYLLEGHGEKELPSTFKDEITKDNYDLHTLSLLKVDSIPEDADCIMIYAPQTDISTEEKNMLTKYVANGGKLFVMAGPSEESELRNLYSILTSYGVTKSDGIVVEADRDHYAFQRPYILLPDMASSDVTDSLIEENYYPILPITAGLNTSNADENVTVLLTTSDESFSKIAGYDLNTYDKEDGDIDGGFAVGVSIEEESGGRIIWYSSSDFMNDMYVAYSSGANTDLAMNSLSALVGQREAIAIRSKSLNYNYLSISQSQGAFLKTILIGIIPLAYLGCGIYIVASTRRKQNEAA